MGHHTISFTDTTVRALSTIPEIQKTVVVLRNAVSVMDKNTPIAKLNIFSLSWNLFHMLYTDPRPYGSDCTCAAAIQLFMFVSSHVALHCMFLLLWICMQSLVLLYYLYFAQPFPIWFLRTTVCIFPYSPHTTGGIWSESGFKCSLIWIINKISIYFNITSLIQSMTLS